MSSKSRTFGAATAAIVFLLAASATILSWRLLRDGESREARSRFDGEVERAAAAIQNSIDEHTCLLRCAQGLFAASGEITRTEWRAYVACLDLDRQYPGVVGLSFDARVPRDRLEAFVAAQRAGGLPEFDVRPAGPRDVYWVIQYSEPSSRNAVALGYDAGTIPAVKAALERAVDTGAIASTGKMRIVQEPANQSAFVLYLPVYERGKPHETVEERRTAALGCVAAPFRAGDLFTAALRSFLPLLEVTAWDGVEAAPESALFASSANGADLVGDAPSVGAPAKLAAVVAGDRIVTLRFRARPALLDVTWNRSSWLLLAVGLVASLLLSSFAWSLATRGARASALARRMTGVLRESEGRFRTLSASSPIGIFETDAEGNGLYSNAQVQEMCGLSAEECSGWHWSKAIHPDDRRWVEEAWAAAARSGLAFDREFRVRRPSGDVRWLRTRSAPLKAESGAVAGHVGTVEDVTERKRSDERMRALVRAIEASADAIYITDVEGVVQYVNPAFCRMMSVTAESVIGRQCPMFGGTDSAHDGLRAFADSARRREVFAGRLPLPRCSPESSPPSVAPIWVQVTLSPIKDESGETLGFVVVERDVTADVCREERESLEKNRAAMRATVAKLLHEQRPLRERMRDVLATILDGGGFGAARRAAVFARTPAGRLDHVAAIGDVPHSFLLEDHPFRAGASTAADGPFILDRCECDGLGTPPHGHWFVELMHRGERVGGLLVYTPSPSPRDAEELEVVRVLGELMALAIANDRLQSELEKARETAEAATRAKSEFLANTSHEIRTPMTAILGFTELLLEPERSEAERREYARTIQRNGDHLVSIINDVLDLSKVEAGKMVVEHLRCSPVAIVSEVCGLMRARAIEKKLGFGMQFVGPVPQTILSDPTRLRQILLNLLGNALKFTERGGVVVLTTLVDLPTAPDPRIAFSVVDTGIGMTHEEADRIFNPFTQADSSMTRRFGGTGLGLSISKRLAAMLGGDVRVTSAPGRGTTFTLTVRTGPLAGVPLVDGAKEVQEVEARRASSASAPPAEIRGRLLLAEDGHDNQVLISLHLRRAGAVVEVAENGRVAVEKAAAALAAGAPFDCILMDMQMPEVDGYTATRRLRELGYRAPIVALTAHAMEGDRAKCLDAGCDQYLTKPVDRLELLAAVTAMVREHRAAAIPPPPLSVTSPLDVDLGEIVAIFTAELPKREAAMRAALGQRDFARLATLAHQMKGAAGGYGFPAIGARAADLEHAAKSPADVEAVRRALDGFAAECATVRPSASGDVPVA
jgi:PAS domain S-box-containing protein